MGWGAGAPGEEARPRRPPWGAWEAPNILGAALPRSTITSFSTDDTSPVSPLPGPETLGVKGDLEMPLKLS